jgi:hypothetical protein
VITCPHPSVGDVVSQSEELFELWLMGLILFRLAWTPTQYSNPRPCQTVSTDQLG